MKMKYLFGSLLAFVISISAFAQNNPGADYLSLGELKLAKEYFTKNMSQNPAEAYYYLGEIAFKEGNMSEARANYQQGVSSNAEAGLPAVGLAKLDLKTNTKVAEDQLKEIQKKNKKDVSVILAIAQAYLDNGMKEKAMEKLQDARKVDKKSPLIYIFEGDMLAAENKPGDAAMQYDQAVNFDENNVLARIKAARVYEYINRNTAIDMLKKVVEINPSYTVVYKELGELYRRDGFYPEAISAYKEYFKGADYTVEDMTRYASALYFTQQYDEAKQIINDGLAKEPGNFVLYRLRMYTDNDTKNYEGAVNAGNKFFSIPLNANDTTRRYLLQDYLSYANALSETGKKTEAVEQYKKAIALDPTKIDENKKVASILAGERMYVDAADFLAKYIELSGEAATAQDYFQLGRYYYFGGANLENDTINMTKQDAKAKAFELYKKAIDTYGIVQERVPDSHLGVYQQALASYRMDPESEQGLAKPYYEKTIEVILAKPEQDDADKKVLVEAYSYLSYYYYLQFDKSKKAEDKANVKSYAEKVLEIDPENANGKMLFEFASSK